MMNYINYTKLLQSGGKITSELVKQLQRSLGFTGKLVDGLYGKNTITAAKKKYGTTNLYKLIDLSKSNTKQPQQLNQKLLPVKSNVDFQSYARRVDFKNNNYGKDVWNATAVGVKVTPNMTPELRKLTIDLAKLTLQELAKINAKKAADLQAIEQQYAVKNYERITGQKFKPGVSKLDGYYRNDVKKLQTQYGLKGSAVDGIWGNGTQAAKVKYEQSLQNSINQKSNSQSASNSDLYDKALTDNKFHQWLYDQGASPEFALGNARTVAGGLARSIAQNAIAEISPTTANSFNTRRQISPGTKMQVLAETLALRQKVNADDQLQTNGQATYTTRDWGNQYGVHRNFNGGKYVNQNTELPGIADLAVRATTRPAEHYLGLYGITEYPDKFTINDRYDFNISDNDISDDTAKDNSYLKLRQKAGLNLKEGIGYNVTFDIDKKDVIDFYNKYQNYLQNQQSPQSTGITPGGYQYQYPGGVDYSLMAFKSGGDINYLKYV